MPQLVPQPSIQFNSSGARDLVGFRFYYKPVFNGPGYTPIPEPFAYNDPYFIATAHSNDLSEAVRIDYVVQLEVDLQHFQGEIRLSVVEVDVLGNLSKFSDEIIVGIDSIAPGGVTDLQLVPTI